MRVQPSISIKHNVTFSGLLILAGSLTLVGNAYASTTWYVNGVSGSNSNNCKSPTTACKTIGHAISLAAWGDSIMVAATTYYEHLTIALNLTILGASAQTTIIDGGGVNTVVTISPSAGQVTLSKLTIRHGFAQNGGGISIPGPYCVTQLTINNSTISGNRAGGTGGGIFINCNGWLTVNNSTISGNSAGYGGGVGASGLGINNSTISGNSAAQQGGGVLAGGMGINNSTISGNSAAQGGGVYLIPGHHGGATLQNSIVAHNIPGGNCLGPMTSKGYNLSSDYTCNFHSSGDRNNINPMLGTLGNYGGPTQTIPLLTGSPAIDAGNPSGCTDGNGHVLKTDQRGYPRPDKEDKTGCGMGAYERQSD